MSLFGRPRLVQVQRQNGEIICHRCILADRFWTRGKGLLGRSHLAEDEGILLVPGTSIHMFGMKFSIDVIYLTRENAVTDIARHLAPGKTHFPGQGAGKAHKALEVAAGTADRFNIAVGELLIVEESGASASQKDNT